MKSDLWDELVRPGLIYVGTLLGVTLLLIGLGSVTGLEALLHTLDPSGDLNLVSGMAMALVGAVAGSIAVAIVEWRRWG